MVDRYPLTWPAGWPRTKYPQSARFNTSFTKARNELMRELDLLGADGIIISSNLETRLDGLPYASQRQPDDSGIAVYFRLEGNDQCIPCDKWYSAADNLQAIRLTVGALRGLERWGAKEMVNAAFRGFKALPAAGEGSESNQRLWHEVLEVSPDASWDVIEAAYRELLHKVHPDKGGTETEFHEVQAAFKQAKELRT
jgi:hypothetical protein